MIQIAWGELHQSIREFESEWMPHLKRGSVIHGRDLLADRFRDLFAAVPRVHAPEACNAVQNLAAIVSPVMHALGTLEQSWIGLELAIGSEGHPQRFEIRARGG